MIPIQFNIWLASKTRWAHLAKTISLPAVPRVGEFLKFRNAQQGDYFAWQVSEVTYRETGTIEISTKPLNDADERGYSFEDEAEFDEYFRSYIDEGWQCERGIGPNRRIAAQRRDTDGA